jgi:hypothetical protein
VIQSDIASATEIVYLDDILVNLQLKETKKIPNIFSLFIE